jgi:ABC-2 type transport system permease protein
VDRVLAIATLRFRLLLRRSRGATGAVKLAAAAIMAVLAAGFAIGVAVGFALLMHFAIANEQALGMRTAFLVVFYTFFVFGVVLPVLSGAMNPGFDASPLRLFPIAPRKLYAITLGANFFYSEHLLYYPALVAVGVTGVLLPGTHVTAGLAVLALTLVFYVVWANVFTLSLTSIMRNRRSREILAILAILILLGFALLPSFLEDTDGNIAIENRPHLETLARMAFAVGEVLPPTLAAEALTALHTSGLGEARLYMFWLLTWDVAGLALGYWVFLRLHLGERGSVRRVVRTRKSPVPRGGPRRHLSAESPALAFIPREVRAVAAKELRYLFRSVIGKFNLIVMPLFVVFVAFVFGRRVSGTYFGFAADDLVLFGILAYTALFSNNFVNNAFAWEGEGIRMYFTGPVPLHRILAGKNLGVWVYNTALLAIVLVTWTLISGLPGLSTLFSAVVLYGACILVFTALGNLISVLFPVARDISSVRNSPSQVGVLLSIVSLSAAVSVMALFLIVPFILGFGVLRPFLLLVLLALAAWAYVSLLRFAGQLMDDRKEKLIESSCVVD